MAAITNADVDKIVERLYTTGITQIGFSKQTPFWSRMPKKSNFYETTLTMRNRFGLNPSGSRTFADSRSNTGASPYGAFQLTRAKDYQALQFENEALLSVRKDSKRLVSLIQEESTSAFQRAGKRMNHAAYRNAGGAITQVASGGATQVITVTARELLINIHPGMVLVSSNTDGTTGTSDANPKTVAAVDREAGTITCVEPTWDDGFPGTFADNDYIFAEGDFGLALFGLDSWVPSVAPTDTFLGQDRSLDPVYLGGIRYVASAGSPDGTIHRTLVNACAEGQVHGAETEDIFMHPLDFAKYVNEVEPRLEYRVPARRGAYGDKDGEMDVGIEAIGVWLPTGKVNIIPDLDCPRSQFWMIDWRTWCFYGLSMTGPDWIITDGGKKFLRMTQSNVDGIEATIGYYGNIGCEGPGCNIRVDASAVLT
jgi:hypothetical protein